MFYPTLAISDEFKGVIRTPFAFYFLTHRGFNGSIQTLPLLWSKKDLQSRFYPSLSNGDNYR